MKSVNAYQPTLSVSWAALVKILQIPEINWVIINILSPLVLLALNTIQWNQNEELKREETVKFHVSILTLEKFWLLDFPAQNLQT